MVNEKLNEFYAAMKELGYDVSFDKSSFDQFQNNNRHVVTKDNYYHVAISEKLILDAPIDYTTRYVEDEFKRLEKQVTQ